VGKRPLGFGDVRQTAEFFGLTQSEVMERARSGEWPSWVIGGKRVFDLDAIIDRSVRQPGRQPLEVEAAR
jgi:hypothetical protein